MSRLWTTINAIVPPRLIIAMTLFVLLSNGLVIAQGNAPIQYFYDDVGRLIKVVDQKGNVASYAYDAAGNVLSITRSTLSALAILNFAPQSGSVGQSVTLQGQGFSTTISSNTVQFNGVTAVVTAATATTLAVTVPSGAATGLISVTVAGSSATSSTNFTVTSALVSVAVTPTSAQINAAGQQQQFTAMGTYADNSQQNITTSVSWSSSNPLAAAISNVTGSKGLATGGGLGTTTISATSGTISGSTSLLVYALPFTVTPASVTFYNQGTQQFTATATLFGGSQQNVTGNLYWSSLNPAVATISNMPGSQGLTKSLGYGTTYICASWLGGATGPCNSFTILPTLVSLAITPASSSLPKGEQQQFAANGTFTDGSIQNISATVTWTSSNQSVATFSNAPGGQGLATATGLGTSTLSAYSGSIGNSTTLTVTAPVPVSLSISPSTDSVQVGTTVQYDAVLVMTDGTTQDVTQSANWTTSQPTVATVNSQGLASPTGVGGTTITATAGGFSGTATLIVTNGAQTVFPRVLYAANYDATISLYNVNSTTGQLRPNGYVAGGGYYSFSATLDPTNSYLYVATELGLQGYSVSASSGALTQIAGSPFSTTTSLGVAVHPSSGFVYTADGGSNGYGTVSGYSVGSNGALTPIAGSPFTTAGPVEAVVIDPTGTFLYALVNYGGTATGSVYAYTIATTTGGLTPISGSPFPTGTNPDGIALTSNGKFLYVANSGQNFGSQNIPLFRPDEPRVAARRELPGDLRLDIPGLKSLLRQGNSGMSPACEAAPILLADASLPGDLMFGTSAGENLVSPIRFHPPLLLRPGSSTGPSISMFDINPASGALTEISSSPMPFSGTPTSITVEKSNQFAYVSTSSQIYGFAIASSNGALTQLADSPYAGSAPKMLVDPSGQFIYGTGQGISSFAINGTTGTLTGVGTFPGRDPQALAIAAGSAAVTYIPDFAYVASSGPGNSNPNGANDVTGYSIDPAAGALTALLSSPFPDGLYPISAAFDPVGSFLYIVNNCSDPGCVSPQGSVSGYAVSATSGGLTTISGAPFLTGVPPNGLVVDPSGRFAYVLEQNNSSILGYAISATTGALTPLAGSPYAVRGFTPVSIAMDQVGLGLIVAGCTGNPCSAGTVVPYSISSTGALETFYTFPAGTSPSGVVMDPTAEFILVADSALNAVFVFSAVPASTAGYYLTSAPGSPFSAGQNPAAIAMDPTGTFVYVANQGSNNISAFTINPSTGTLAQVNGSPFASGTTPTSLAVDISGKFLYSTNNGDGTVAAFAIDSSSGALTPVSGSPFPTGTAPVSIVTTGTVQ